MTLWRTQPRAAAVGESARERHLSRNFASGLLLMLGHVQAILFYAALLPGLVDLAALGAADLLLVAAMIVVVIGGVNAGYALMAARARRLFTDERALTAMNRLAGTLMFVAAALVATRV